MKTVMKVLGVLAMVLVVVVGGALAWAFSTAYAKMEPQRFAHVTGKDLPVPWPLTEAEIEEIKTQKLAETQALADASPPPEGGAAAVPADPLAGVDLEAIALERALERGNHLLQARIGCNDCHAADYTGQVLIDVPPMGRWVCPNITSGDGGRTKGFTPADWDRVIRHGVGKDGRGLTMPSRDFANLSDQEVSDLIAVVSRTPPVDKEQPAIRLGPIYALLIASGEVPIDAENIDHAAARAALPPQAAPTVEFGAHMAQVCQGCHQADLAGGPITGGDPSWPPARNLTPHETGLKDWTLEDFQKALREGKRKDGTDLDPAMPWVMTKNMTDAEIEALYTYLRTLPPKPWPGKG